MHCQFGRVSCADQVDIDDAEVRLDRWLRWIYGCNQKSLQRGKIGGSSSLLIREGRYYLVAY
jgi:hypothetical protein